MAYREQVYIERAAERCFCGAAMAQRCRCCRRPRCRTHVARGLCDRCGQALARHRPALSAWAMVVGGGVGVALTLALLPSASAIVLGSIAAGIVGAVAYRRLVTWTLARLRPWLATTVGELPMPARDEPKFPTAGGSGVSRSSR